jgi:hypothetical protein
MDVTAWMTADKNDRLGGLQSPNDDFS